MLKDFAQNLGFFVCFFVCLLFLQRPINSKLGYNQRDVFFRKQSTFKYYQWLALLPHSEKVLRSTPLSAQGLCVWSLYIFSMFV